MPIQFTDKDRERFERFVDRAGGPDACHPWMGYRQRTGYGRFALGGGGRAEKAHRVAWVLAGHEITPDKPLVLHNCPEGDNPSCCNDRHLWVGTQADNCRDMALKGRGRKSKRGLPFGVSIQPSGRFQAHLRVDGKTLGLGTYDTAEEASAAAIEAKSRLIK